MKFTEFCFERKISMNQNPYSCCFKCLSETLDLNVQYLKDIVLLYVKQNIKNSNVKRYTDDSYETIKRDLMKNNHVNDTIALQSLAVYLDLEIYLLWENDIKFFFEVFPRNEPEVHHKKDKSIFLFRSLEEDEFKFYTFNTLT